MDKKIDAKNGFISLSDDFIEVRIKDNACKIAYTEICEIKYSKARLLQLGVTTIINTNSNAFNLFFGTIDNAVFESICKKLEKKTGVRINYIKNGYKDLVKSQNNELLYNIFGLAAGIFMCLLVIVSIEMIFLLNAWSILGALLLLVFSFAIYKIGQYLLTYNFTKCLLVAITAITIAAQGYIEASFYTLPAVGRLKIEIAKQTSLDADDIEFISFIDGNLSYNFHLDIALTESLYAYNFALYCAETVEVVSKSKQYNDINRMTIQGYAPTTGVKGNEKRFARFDTYREQWNGVSWDNYYRTIVNDVNSLNDIGHLWQNIIK